jgi:hypothetical protein
MARGNQDHDPSRLTLDGRSRGVDAHDERKSGVCYHVVAGTGNPFERKLTFGSVL